MANLSILVVVEDEPDMREVIKLMLMADPRLEIAGEAESADEAIELARTMDPGLIILDHNIKGNIMGIQAAPLLKDVAPNAKILLFTAFDLAAEAKQEPAIDGYLRKDHLEKLVPTVDTMLGLDPLASSTPP